MANNSKEAKTRAEASFKKKEQQAQEGAKARMQYEAERHAVREKTARLRILRLAKEAADKEAEANKPPAPAKKPAAAAKKPAAPAKKPAAATKKPAR